jgi:hypothetical protein
MSLEKFKGKTALVTGASSGIGDSFAKLLAQSGVNLILVARRVDRLEALKATLEDKHGVKVDVIAQDLSSIDAAQLVFDATEGRGQQVDILINNAGYGKQGAFSQSDLDVQVNMLDLNIRTLTALSHLFIYQMKQRKSGYVLLVGSVGAFLPVPNMAAYAASKAYVRSFGEALNRECQADGVSVSVLNPGGTSTEFNEVAGQQLSAVVDKLFMMSAENAARIGLNALIKNKPSVVAGLSNAAGMFMLRFIPRFVQTSIAGQVFK